MRGIVGLSALLVGLVVLNAVAILCLEPEAPWLAVGLVAINVVAISDYRAHARGRNR